jgi:hypothetical protein
MAFVCREGGVEPNSPDQREFGGGAKRNRPPFSLAFIYGAKRNRHWSGRDEGGYAGLPGAYGVSLKDDLLR